MSTLRERLIAMSDSTAVHGPGQSRLIALAAARMALEDAAQIVEREVPQAVHTADTIRDLRYGLD